MESVDYLKLNFSKVVNKGDFFKGNLPEMIQVRSLYDSIKLLLNLSSDVVIINVSETDRIYSYTILSPTVNKFVLGKVVYLPLLKRLDIYNGDNLELPLIQFKNKKPVFKNYSILLDRAGMDKLFNKLLNSI